MLRQDTRTDHTLGLSIWHVLSINRIEQQRRGMSLRQPKLPGRGFFSPSSIICDSQDFTMHTTMSDGSQLFRQTVFLCCCRANKWSTVAQSPDCDS